MSCPFVVPAGVVAASGASSSVLVVIADRVGAESLADLVVIETFSVVPTRSCPDQVDGFRRPGHPARAHPGPVRHLESYADAARTWLHDAAGVIDTTHLTTTRSARADRRRRQRLRIARHTGRRAWANCRALMN
ncbi:hypothetical protein MXD60_12460 [Frankia sp. AgB32]|nr:hypothetical protein [Frankia sp. AgB32]MCK9895396.1 hypothetical protein [Frankia sp. AgB32]